MVIDLQKVSKRFLSGYILRDIDYRFEAGKIYGIAGQNGSGKTTLMKIISGYLTASSGKVIYTSEKNIPRDEVYKYISYSAPYMEIEEDFSLREQLDFYSRFKSLDTTFKADEVLERVGLLQHKEKQIKNFSSGMKQKLQLILAMYTDAELVLLDEPTSFLDAKSKLWFYDLLSHKAPHKTIVVSSNDPDDLQFCESIIDLGEG